MLIAYLTFEFMQTVMESSGMFIATAEVVLSLIAIGGIIAAVAFLFLGILWVIRYHFGE